MELMHKALQVSTHTHHEVPNSPFTFQEPATAKQTFFSAHEPTVWCTIPVLEFLLQLWENMANLPKTSKLGHVICKGLKNINKWYHKVNDMDAYPICLGKVGLVQNQLDHMIKV